MMNEAVTDTPVGKLLLKATADTLSQIEFVGSDTTVETGPNFSEIIIETLKQLKEYFEGTRTTFELPLSPQGTDFQQRVWHALQDIPYGQTVTYSQLSNDIGNPKAIRAVGRANGQNPIPIIIPCHRVIGANNKLVGYGGGIERKRWLLQHEGALLL